MYALSLWQPWASFIAVGIKPFETRDWKPPKWLIGQRIAIHAAKKSVHRDDRSWADEQGVRDLPLGAVVCTAVLRGAYHCAGLVTTTPTAIATMGQVPGSPNQPIIAIDEFGDYTAGRWAWWLADIEKFDPVIPAKGAQGFWKWANADITY